jgi:hypothetical protein
MLMRAKVVAIGLDQLLCITRTQTRTNTYTNPNDTEAKAKVAGRSARACVARKSKSQMERV